MSSLSEDELGRIWINTRGQTKARRLEARAELQRRGLPAPTAGRPQPKTRWETQSQSDLSAEEIQRNFKATHDRLVAQGATLADESQSGSRYYRMPDGQMVRVADHAPNEATQQWIDRNEVEEIRVDLRRGGAPSASTTKPPNNPGGGSFAALIAPAEGSDFVPPEGGKAGALPDSGQDDADVVRITGEELGPGDLPIRELIDRARAFAQANYRRTIAHAPDADVIVSWQGVKHALGLRTGPDRENNRDEKITGTALD